MNVKQYVIKTKRGTYLVNVGYFENMDEKQVLDLIMKEMQLCPCDVLSVNSPNVESVTSKAREKCNNMHINYEVLSIIKNLMSLSNEELVSIFNHKKVAEVADDGLKMIEVILNDFSSKEINMLLKIHEKNLTAGQKIKVNEKIGYVTLIDKETNTCHILWEDMSVSRSHLAELVNCEMIGEPQDVLVFPNNE